MVTLIQRFGSAANLNIHLHCLVLDGVPLFHEAAAPSTDELEAVLLKIITRTMRLLTRLGALIEEPERTYLAETDSDGALKNWAWCQIFTFDISRENVLLLVSFIRHRDF